MEVHGQRREGTGRRRWRAAAAAPRGRGAGLRVPEPRPGGPAECAGYRAYGADDGGYAASALAEEDTAAQILLRGLIDDGGLCPLTTPDRPGSGGAPQNGSAGPADTDRVPQSVRRASPDSAPLPVVQGVERHRSDRIVGHPMLSHRLLCPASRWDDLLKRIDGSAPVDVALILDTDAARAGELPERDPRARIAHYETRAHPDDLRPVADLFRNGDIGVAGRVVYFESARGADRLDAVDILGGARPLGAKLRCGGPRSEPAPGAREVGAFITACVERDVPFVAAAGLHRAAGRTDPATGGPQYGYLNLLLATAAVVDGAYDTVVELLTCTDVAQLVRVAIALHPATALRTRELLVGYASRSTGDPVREAAALGLLGTWVP